MLQSYKKDGFKYVILFWNKICYYRSNIKVKTMRVIYILLLLVMSLQAQQTTFKTGEFLKYRMHYGVVNAGYASVQVEDATVNNQPHYHVKGLGWTTGMLRWVFPVKDDYQSYINKKTFLPSRAIRKVKEGGHGKDIELLFQKDSVITLDHKRDKRHATLAKGMQDMISSFYYLRTHVPQNMKNNQSIEIPMFFDKKINPFKMVKLGEEIIKTEFGNINCIKFRPIVYSGRVFKEKESLTIWVSNDENKIPVSIQADLAIGSLKADITEFRGLTHPLKIIDIDK